MHDAQPVQPLGLGKRPAAFSGQLPAGDRVVGLADQREIPCRVVGHAAGAHQQHALALEYRRRADGLAEPPRPGEPLQGRRHHVDEHGNDRIGVERTENAVGRLRETVIDGHGVRNGRIEALRARMADHGERLLVRHVERTGKAADIVHRLAAQPDAGRRHPVQMEAAVVIGAEQDHEFRVEGPHGFGLLRIGGLNGLMLRRFFGVTHQDRRMGQAEKIAAHAEAPSGSTGANLSLTNIFATDRLANNHRPPTRR